MSGVGRSAAGGNRRVRVGIVLAAFAALVAVATGLGSGISLASPADLPSLSINDVSQTEGNNGNKNFVFTVTLSPSDKPVKVDSQTVNGTATLGSDFNPSQASLSVTRKNLVVRHNLTDTSLRGTPPSCAAEVPVGRHDALLVGNHVRSLLLYLGSRT